MMVRVSYEAHFCLLTCDAYVIVGSATGAGMQSDHCSRSHNWRVLFCWLLFVAGVGVHFAAPNLDRQDKAFVIPLAPRALGETVQPERLVAKERRLQLLSAVLAASGALGLGWIYRKVLFRGASRSGADAPQEQAHGSVVRPNIPEPVTHNLTSTNAEQKEPA